MVLSVCWIRTQVSTGPRLIAIPTPVEYEADVTVFKKYCYRNIFPYLQYDSD